MNAFATEAEIEFDFNDFAASPEKLVQKYSSNHHKGFLNINVMRDNKKKAIAKMIHNMEEVIKSEVIKEDFKMERFKSNIRKPEGKLTMKDLSKLNSVYKGAYKDETLLE